MKLPTVPWLWIIAGNLSSGIIFSAGAFFQAPGWVAMLDATMAGACFSAATHSVLLARTTLMMREIGEVCTLLNEINTGLINELQQRGPALAPDDTQPRIY